MDLSKEEFRKEVKRRGYGIRFQKVSFEGRGAYDAPIVKKGAIQINGGNVFSEDFIREHHHMIELCRQHKLFKRVDD